jgi:hypothetical protein
VKDDAH